MKERFSVLENVIKSKIGNKPVYYIPNIGNWGDGLIRYGTLKFLADTNIDYKEISKKRIDWFLPSLRGGTVLYGGGGAWCSLWDHSQKYVKRLKNWFNIIVLPSTYESKYTFDNTTFFCRDQYQSQENMPDATFCHDMAFFIDNEFTNGQKGSGKGYFFRKDSESANQLEIPFDNNDISQKGNYKSDVAPFFEEINKFEIVYTDRLHVSIAACLLKKEVHLYQGAYFKNHAIYLSSLRDNFDNIHFHDTYEL